MFRNYFKTSVRSILRNPLSSFINVFGLAVAIGFCVVTYAYLHAEFTMEEQHTKADRTFMITNTVANGDVFGFTPRPIGQQLNQEFSQITRMTRIDDQGVVVKHGDNVFHEWTRMVDPEFTEMFDFNIKGETSLRDRNTVIINERVAEKYFGKENPLGQTLQMRFPGSHKVTLKVVGIATIQRDRTCLGFDFLTNFELKEIVSDDFAAADWSKNISATFIELMDPIAITEIHGELTDYTALVNSAQPDREVTAFGFEPLSTLYEKSKDIRWDISGQADTEGHVVLTIIAIMMLILACLNYVNIAISSATKRLKEIGIRKVIGANRGRLVIQFLVENLVLCSIALVVGIILGITVFLPGFMSLFEWTTEVDLFRIEFIIFIISMLVLTSAISGAYPALYISGFQVISIFRGKLRFGQKNLVTKSFLTFQFMLACLTVSTGIIFSQNTEFQQQKDWGYDQEGIIMVEVPDFTAYEKFKNALIQKTEVLAITGSTHQLGHSIATSNIEFPDQKMEVRRLDVGPNYLPTLGIEVVEGSGFREDYASDQNKVMINETFVKKMGWEDALGKTFRYDSTQYTIAGVLKDFHYYSFWSEIEPVFVRLAKEENYRFLSVKTPVETIIPTYEEIESTWGVLFPDDPFDGAYQSQLFKGYFDNINGHKILMITIAIVALLLSCFGLYGLVSLNVQSRLKEFSVRKVLGADLLAITRSISSHFMTFMIIAMILGGPLSFYVVNLFLDSIYTFHVPVRVWPILIAIVVVLATVGLTISSQVQRIARRNPTEGLRVD